jgi:AcrR family transcriptional regulator
MSATKRPAPPAHRRSRRDDIVDAAIRLFARKGFVDASIGDVAEEADVVVTAIYYHFSGKEDLFSAAVNKVFEQISAVVSNARPPGSQADAAGLDRVVDAVWEWVDTHPDEATLVHLQLPGATPQIATLRHDFEERHMQRALGYLGADASDATPAQRRAVEMLTVRTLVDLLMAVHTMRLAHGPLSGEESTRLLATVRALTHRLVRIDG